METTVRWYESARHGTKRVARVPSSSVVLGGRFIQDFSGVPCYLLDEPFIHFTLISVNPSTVVDLDIGLAGRTDVASHPNTWGVIPINSPKPPEVSQRKLDLHGYMISTMDFTVLRYGMGYKC